MAEGPVAFLSEHPGEKLRFDGWGARVPRFILGPNLGSHGAFSFGLLNEYRILTRAEEWSSVTMLCPWQTSLRRT
jgi:hypothetical protein